MEEQQKMKTLKKQKRREEEVKIRCVQLTQIDFVKRDMQFSVRQQLLRRMGILEGEKLSRKVSVVAVRRFLCKLIHNFTVTECLGFR